jgi:hypothetical protein
VLHEEVRCGFLQYHFRGMEPRFSQRFKKVWPLP